jgi:toxin ParE1/3/4
MRYRIAKSAARDLDEIFEHWARRVGVEIADRVIDGITDRFWLLGEHPNTGKSASELAPGMKIFPAGRYLIYYRRARGRTEIVHIFHGARNQRSAFRVAKKRR